MGQPQKVARMNAPDRGDRRYDPSDFAEAGLRVPPHSIEAEQSVLGGLLLHNSAWDLAGDLVIDTDFYRFEHRLIFAAISSLITANKPADVITVCAQLQRSGKGDECGGLVYLNELAASVPSAANMRRYAGIVREHAVLRALIALVDEGAAMAWRQDDVAATIDHISVGMQQLERKQVRKAPRLLGEIIVERLDRITNLQTGEAESGWATKIPALDRMLNGGLRPGMVYVLAARPSVGKSSFVESVAIALAEQGLPALMLSQEMPEGESLIARSAASGASTMERCRAAR
jgi:replicative DNA helicase